MNPLRILLADDHDLVRAGIRALIQSLRGVEVVGEAADGAQVIELIPQCQPDVVILDVAMPGLNGFETAERIARDYPQVRVLFLSLHANEEYVRRAFDLGAAGYLLKGSRRIELEMALLALARGEQYLSSELSELLVRGAWGRAVRDPINRLTARQLQVLKLIAAGRTRRQISQELGISPKTVDTLRGQLLKQLKVRDVPSLLRIAVRSGLVEPL